MSTGFPDNVLTEIYRPWSDGRISDAELVAGFVLILSRLVHGKNWVQGTRRFSHSVVSQEKITSPRFIDDVLREFLPEYRRTECSLAEFCARYRIKSIREASLNILSTWLDRELPLFVSIGPVSADSLLEKQSYGMRCVSVFVPPCDWFSPVVNGKTPLDFTLHDLDHASKFIDDDLSYRAQVGFFDCLHKVVQTSHHLESLRRRDSRFEREFVYLMSDMNTHCAHQREYWKAILIQAFLRDEGRSATDVLGLHGRESWNALAIEVRDIVGFDLFALPVDEFSRGLVARGSAVLSGSIQ